jgi:hypothetical protein
MERGGQMIMLHRSIRAMRQMVAPSRVRVFLHISDATRLPAPPSRVPPFVLMRQLDGDLLITPFPRDRLYPRPVVLIKMVGLRLARHLFAGCFWVDTQDGRVTPPTIAIPQLKRRLLSICASFNVRMPTAA